MNHLSADDLRKIAPKLLAANIQAARPAVAAPSVEGGFGGKESTDVVSSPPVSASTTEADEERKSSHRRNEVWDVCTEVLGYGPKTDTEKSLWGKKVTSLRRAEATPDQIRSVAEWYHKKWPDIDLTITALEKWFSHFLQLSTQKSRVKQTLCPHCDMGGGRHSSDCRDAPKPRLAVRPLTDELMVPLAQLVRELAFDQDDDTLRATITALTAGTPAINPMDIDELMNLAGVVRAARELGTR